jgi:hypothetical protein
MEAASPAANEFIAPAIFRSLAIRDWAEFPNPQPFHARKQCAFLQANSS